MIPRCLASQGPRGAIVQLSPEVGKLLFGTTRWTRSCLFSLPNNPLTEIMKVVKENSTVQVLYKIFLFLLYSWLVGWKISMCSVFEEPSASCRGASEWSQLAPFGASTKTYISPRILARSGSSLNHKDY